MRTRCKFRVVGIENVDSQIYSKVWKADVPAEQYDAIESHEWEGYREGPSEKHKMVPSGKYQQNIRLAAQYDPTIPEDKRFMEATPTGELKIFLNNPAVIGNIKLGEDYYVDLIPCGE